MRWDSSLMDRPLLSKIRSCATNRTGLLICCRLKKTKLECTGYQVQLKDNKRWGWNKFDKSQCLPESFELLINKFNKINCELAKYISQKTAKFLYDIFCWWAAIISFRWYHSTSQTIMHTSKLTIDLHANKHMDAHTGTKLHYLQKSADNRMVQMLNKWTK